MVIDVLVHEAPREEERLRRRNRLPVDGERRRTVFVCDEEPVNETLEVVAPELRTRHVCIAKQIVHAVGVQVT